MIELVESVCLDRINAIFLYLMTDKGLLMMRRRNGKVGLPVCANMTHENIDAAIARMWAADMRAPLPRFKETKYYIYRNDMQFTSAIIFAYTSDQVRDGYRNHRIDALLVCDVELEILRALEEIEILVVEVLKDFGK